MASPTDIISYIGIPLAVVGVLPIIYSSVNGAVTVSNIRKKLRKNGLPAVTRGSYLAGIVEIELPRWTITPLDREEPKYWTLNPDRSDLPGGSWTIFNWNQVATGKKLYRLQYSADLREPQAEIGFEELLAFLLDRGAVPDAKGLHLLRLAGLFTPYGTSLLLSPDCKETVLRIGPSDESDGILSLTLHWKSSFDQRDDGSLPPSWMRIRPFVHKQEAKDTDSSAASDEKKDAAAVETEEIKSQIRFHLGIRSGSLCIDSPSWAGTPTDAETQLSVDHLQEAWAGLWVPAVAAALGQIQQLALWTCHIPDTIATLAQKDVLPCGVMVMAGVLDEKDSPPWETKNDPHEEATLFHRQAIDDARARESERHMSPAQQADAQMKRTRDLARRHQDRIDRDRKRRDQRAHEALSSSRLDTQTMVKPALQYLQEKHEFSSCGDVQQATEKILHIVIQDKAEAKEICEFLNRWQRFYARGGLNIEDLEACQKSPKTLSIAVCLVSCLKLAGNQETSSLALDLQECVRVWKKIRLG